MRLLIDGQARNIDELALAYSVPADVIRWRVERGWCDESAAKTPVGAPRTKRIADAELAAITARARPAPRPSSPAPRKAVRQRQCRRKAQWHPSPDQLWPVDRRGHRGNVSRTIKHNGVELTVIEWANRLGISAWSINYRLREGWPIGRALDGRFRPRH